MRCLLALFALVALLPPGDAAADACRALEVAVPSAFDSRTKHDVAIPDIIDFGDSSLDAFFEKLARVARGKPGAIVRIGTYGDSNWTNDQTAGEIRRRLQTAFGDAGHGFVAFGTPWNWYRHQNVRHGLTGRWDSLSLTANEGRDRIYGFAGAAAESSHVGATVWAETARPTEPVGTAVSTFEVSYLARPKGGAFEILIDNESKAIVDTAHATAETKFLRYQVPDGAHRLTVKVKQGAVRVFGVTLERDVTGIVVDGIGMNALNPPRMLAMDAASMTAGLARRNYDLLLETTGTMVWHPRKHPSALPDILARFRAALPNAALLLWSPPDFITKDTKPAVSLPYMAVFAKEKREIAKVAKVGFWDQYDALGGSGSAPKLLRSGWIEGDGVHVGPKLSAYIGERFVFVLLRELARRVDKNPKLGCGSAR